MTVSTDFISETEPFRRELLAYCYRMLGSVHDAEDLVQETYLRAWRAYGRFEGRVVAADLAVPDRHQRLPDRAGAARPPAAALRARRAGRRPGRRWSARPPRCPGCSRSRTRWPRRSGGHRGLAGGLRLALIAALQYLPARQRAVLILRDVLDWPAAEVAGLLGTTTAAVNSALQRARAQLAELARPRTRWPSRPTRPAGTARPICRGVRDADTAALAGCCATTWCWRCRRCSPGSPGGTTSPGSSPPRCSRTTSSGWPPLGQRAAGRRWVPPRPQRWVPRARPHRADRDHVRPGPDRHVPGSRPVPEVWPAREPPGPGLAGHLGCDMLDLGDRS